MERPDRAIVERIIREEAEAVGLTFNAIAGSWGRADAAAARHKAIRRIRDETGCSVRGLAEAWGLSRATVSNAYRPKPVTPGKPAAPLYDADACRRLAWAHGEQRAAAIVAGHDRLTEIDIERWRSLGDRGTAA